MGKRRACSIIAFLDRTPHAWSVGMTIWDQPKENSLAALLHGMQIADGIEFDLRISSDGDFVVYHNELVPGEGDKSERSI